MGRIALDGLTVYVEKSLESQGTLLLSLEMVNRKLTVYGPQRAPFLELFVHLLKYKKKEYGLQGPRQLAKLLCVIANFRDCRNSRTNIGFETIEKELIALKKEHYPNE